METGARNQQQREKIVQLEKQIAALKHTESALKRERDFTNKVLYWIDSLVVVIDLEGRVISFNKAAEQLSGYHFEDFGDTPFWDILILPEEREGVSSTISDVIEKGMPKNFQNRWVTKNGETRRINWTNSILREPQGAIEYILCTGLDFTDRARAEKALRESETKYRELVQSANSIIMRLDRKGNVTFINNFAEEFFGFDEDELIGRNIVGTTLPETDMNGQNLAPLISEITDNPDRYVIYENENICKNGERVWVAWTNKVIYNEAGDVAEILCIGNDNTERKRLEKELQQAQKMESIGTLAGGIAHDFNNILSAILGYSELALVDLPSENPIRNNLEAIHSSGLRARDLVTQILAFSRKDEHASASVAMHLIIKDALRLLRPAIPTTIDIQTQITSKCQIVGDPSRLHQIIMNLCTNAYQAMLEAGGVLTISLSQVSMEGESALLAQVPAGSYAKLIISDTGVGILPENLTRIFDPYFTTKEKGKGTGLGLAAVHGIVKSHGGAIFAESEFGKGTRFTVYFPATHDRSTTQKQTEIQINGGDERILLVDDEQDILQVEKEMLAKHGYSVTAKDDAQEALHLFAAQPEHFDLVITDMTMPNLAGDKLAEEMIKIRSEIPIILCTGFSQLTSKEDAESKGIRGFLMKPVVFRDLLGMIRSVLNDAKAPSQ